MYLNAEEQRQIQFDSTLYHTFTAVMQGLPATIASLLQREGALELYGIHIVRDEIGAPTLAIECMGRVIQLVPVRS